MSYGATAGSAATAHAAMANAVKASGSIVRVDVGAFETVLSRCQNPLVVYSEKRFFTGGYYKYLTSYKGLTFYTKSKEPLMLPSSAEVVQVEKIWIPS